MGLCQANESGAPIDCGASAETDLGVLRLQQTVYISQSFIAKNLKDVWNDAVMIFWKSRVQNADVPMPHDLVKQFGNKATDNRPNLSLIDELRSQGQLTREYCDKFDSDDDAGKKIFDECLNFVIKNYAKTEISKCDSLSGDNYFNCLLAIFSNYREKKDCLGLADLGAQAVCQDYLNFITAYAKYERTLCAEVKMDKLNKYCLKVIIDKKQDTDNDGLTDLDEINKYRTDYKAPDSDGDGILDGEAVKRGLIKARQ